MRLCAACLAICPTVAAAEQDFTVWLDANLGFITQTTYAGQWTAPKGEIFAIDPLTLYGSARETITVPKTEAAVIGWHETEVEGRTAIMALAWSDAPFICGEDLAVIGVDTGLAAFVTPANVAALQEYMDAHGDLYQGTYGAQIDTLYPGPFLTDLPGDTSFPLSGSGWGDGGYPVTALYDADGQMVVLFAQFITGEGQDWLTPPPCDKPIS